MLFPCLDAHNLPQFPEEQSVEDDVHEHIVALVQLVHQLAQTADGEGCFPLFAADFLFNAFQQAALHGAGFHKPEQPGIRSENLQFLAGIRRKTGKKEIDEAIRKVGLDPEAKKHVGKYSLGMRQRLGIAQAIMEEPSLLILDEPMNGLDNQGVQEMRQLFLKLKDEGKTILLASHNREDIAALCDTTVEIDRGKIVG